MASLLRHEDYKLPKLSIKTTIVCQESDPIPKRKIVKQNSIDHPLPDSFNSYSLAGLKKSNGTKNSILNFPNVRLGVQAQAFVSRLFIFKLLHKIYNQ